MNDSEKTFNYSRICTVPDWLLFVFLSKGCHSILPVSGVILLLSFLLCPVEALAESVVSAYSNSRGSFSIMANNLNRVVEAEININYQSDDPSLPQVSSSYLDPDTTPSNTPGSLAIRIKSKKPLSGYVNLAIAQIRGSITYLSAVLRSENGTVETAQVSITNPTQEQLDAMAAQWAKSNPKDTAEKSDKAKAAVTDKIDNQSLARSKVAIPAVAVPGDTGAERLRKEKETPRALRFSRRASLFEQFIASSGERTTATLYGLLRRNESDVVQKPALLLSDGTASLSLTVRPLGSGGQAPQFFISGGTCINLSIGEKGAWILEIIPEKGTMTTSVTVLAGWEAIEYPLAVAPPLTLFDATKTSRDLAEFVRVANALKKK